MLSQDFLSDLRAQFPEFYARVNEEAMRDASRLRAESGGDVNRALVRARVQGAASVWWPYVQGVVPVVGNRRPAMEAFTRLVLTVDHLVGYQPADMDTARRQVSHVLEEAIDAERIMKLVGLDKKEEKAAAAGAAGAAAAGGMMASLTTLVAPFQTLRQARRFAKFIPFPARVAIGAAVMVTLASIPLMAGVSAATNAERAARNFGELPEREVKAKVDVRP